MDADVTSYYDHFSRQVGLRDWAHGNPRHEHLKRIVDGLLRERRELSILDVGCGAGVLSGHLTKFGKVVGIDPSAPAIELARVFVPSAEFHAGTLDMVDVPGPFDVVTAFDVLEHIRPDDRRSFFTRLRALLAPYGTIVLSTPHGRHTRWLYEHHRERMQPIDEPVDVLDLVRLASDIGLDLSYYVTYDVDHAVQYQLFAFAPAPDPGSRPARDDRLLPRLRRRRKAGGHVLRRVSLAVRMGRSGDLRLAAWTLLPSSEAPATQEESSGS